MTFKSLHAILSDSSTMSFRAQPFKPEDTRIWLKKILNSYHEPGNGRRVVILKENNDLIGDAGVMFNPKHGC
jgi:RimJ/RimL family protein N-acetyltransferase